MTPSALLDALADRITLRVRDTPLLVAIDGVDGARKTTLADRLAPLLAERGHEVARISIDGFHLPREIRQARCALSPDGYYHDSFDYRFLIDQVLLPAKRAAAPVTVPTAIFDWRSDAQVAGHSAVIMPRAIVLFDGVFCFRPALNAVWDLRIFVRIRSETSLRRGVERDRGAMGGPAATRERYERRYLPGQQLYLAEVDPAGLADIVIDNDELERPTMIG